VAICFVCGLDASHKRESMKTRNPSRFMKELFEMQVLADLGSPRAALPTRLSPAIRIPGAEIGAGLKERAHA